MQQEIEKLHKRLTSCLDSKYNVKDMGTVLEIIAQLAKTPINKEILERTRLGREINNIRRKNENTELNKRAKDLVRVWRRIVMEEERKNSMPDGGSSSNDSANNFSSSNGHVSLNAHLSGPAASVLVTSISTGRTPEPRRSSHTAPPSPAQSIPRPVASYSGSCAEVRPVTAPTSPAVDHTLFYNRHEVGPPSDPGKRNRATYSAPSSPALYNSANDASRNGGSYSSRPLSPATRETSSKQLSKTNVANKRLRKEFTQPIDDDDDIIELCEEPPSKRQKVVGDLSQSMTNGGIVEVEDSNSQGASSSGSSYCEVIDSFPVTSSKSFLQTHMSSNRASNFSSIKHIASNKSERRAGCRGASSEQLSLVCASVDGSLPSSSRAVVRNSSIMGCAPAAGSSVTVDISNINAYSSPKDVTATGCKETKHSGRGRGRRKATIHVVPEIKIPATKGKVKTTSELVAELAQRKGDSMLARRASKLEEEQQKQQDEMARNKLDHMCRYVRSLPSPPDRGGKVSGRSTPSVASPVGIITLSRSVSPRSIVISPEPPTQKQDAKDEVKEEHSPLEEPVEEPYSVLDRLGITLDEPEEKILSYLPQIDLEAVRRMQIHEEDLDNVAYGHTEDGAEELVGYVPWQPALKQCTRTDKMLAIEFCNPLAIEFDDLPNKSDFEEKSASHEESAVVIPRPIPRAEVLISREKLRDQLCSDDGCLVEGVTGVKDKHGDFRHWHEIVESTSYLDNTMNILPFVILDF